MFETTVMLRFAAALLIAIVPAMPGEAGTIDPTSWCCEQRSDAPADCSETPAAECLRAGGTPGLGECVGERCAAPVSWCCERDGPPGPFCSMDPPARCLREGGSPLVGSCDPSGVRCLPL